MKRLNLSASFDYITAIKLRELLKEKRTTYKELAEHLDVKQQSVSSWANGTTIPDTKHIAPIAEYFGVTTDYLLGLSDSRNPEQLRAFESDWDSIIQQVMNLPYGSRLTYMRLFEELLYISQNDMGYDILNDIRMMIDSFYLTYQNLDSTDGINLDTETALNNVISFHGSKATSDSCYNSLWGVLAKKLLYHTGGKEETQNGQE